MYIKRIELQGFKSFATKTVLEFNKGITSVVGPNGSGKSNIADAVRWVLGEQSPKQLRGSKMFDVIFNGTQFRRSVGFAEVSLVICNEDETLPIEYTEVVITRRLYRNGDSEYLINKNNCRLKDITSLFLDTGVGKEGYSIVGQGKIQEIISSKAEDRRGFFEEAAGIMKYKVRKQEAQRKLLRTEENLTRLNDILNELKTQLGPLKVQSIKAKEYLELTEVLKKNEVGLYLNNLNNFKNRIEKYEKEILVLFEDVENEKKTLEDTKSNNTVRNNSIKELDIIIEDSRNNLNEFLMQVKTTIHEINMSNERIKSIEENIKRNSSDIEEIDDREKILDTDYNKKEQRVNYYKKQYEEYNNQLLEQQKIMSDILNKLGEVENSIQEFKDMNEENIDNVSDLKFKIRLLDNSNTSISTELNEIELDINKAILNKDRTLINKQEIDVNYKNAKKNFDKNKDELAVTLSEINKNENIIRDSRDKLEQYRTKLGILDNNLKIVIDMDNRMEGYRNSVRTIMEEVKSNNTSLTNIYNIFGKLINVPNEYEVAIEAALGGNIQNVVVKDEYAAKTAIEFLKNNNKGRATFMPLNVIRRNEIRFDLFKRIKNQNGFINIADKLVNYDIEYDNAVSNLLGKIVIVDSYNNAVNISRQIKGDYKIVTLQGEFFNIGGTISGGSMGRKGTRILGRENEIKDLKIKIVSLKERIIEIESIINEAKTKNTSFMSQKNDLDNKIAELLSISIRLEAQVSQANVDFDKIVRLIENLKKQKENKHNLKTVNLENVHNYKKDLEIIENQINENKVKINEFVSVNEEDRKKRDEISMLISELKVASNSFLESINNANDTLERLNIEKDEISKRKEMRSLDSQELNKRKIEIIDIIKDKEKFVKEPETKENELKEILDTYKNQRNEFEIENESYVEEVNNINKNILLLQNKITKIEINKAKNQTEIETMQNRMWEEYDLTHNEALEKHKEIENIANARSEINRCKKRMNELGIVNINSIEDYKKTNERFVFMSTQIEDLEKSKKNLYRIIYEMNSVMKKIFVQKFQKINEKFDTIFKNLFEGGRAKIVLIDENDVLESGIDIIVQPPGKKLQNMMLLSGGEKTFTAIALIFAILDLNPSPFCIFDEIEAALDESNVLKFAEYVNDYKNKTQFILITHRKGTMEHSDALYGVTMQEHGISKIVSMNMIE